MTPERQEFVLLLDAITRALPQVGLPDRENTARLVQQMLQQERLVGRARIDGADLRTELAKQILARRCGNNICDGCSCRREDADMVRGGPVLEPADGTVEVPAEWIEVGRDALRVYIDQRTAEQRRVRSDTDAETVTRVVLEAVAGRVQFIPKQAEAP